MTVQIFKRNTSGTSCSNASTSQTQFSHTAAQGFPNTITTDEVGKALHVMPNSIRSALSKTGDYLGLKPVKLPNRRLVWDADAVATLLKTGDAH